MRNKKELEIMPVDVTDITINRAYTKPARIRSFIDQAGDPYRLRYGKTIIEIEYMNTTDTLQDRLRECLLYER